MKYLFLILLFCSFSHQNYLPVKTMDIYILNSYDQVYSPIDNENRMRFNDTLYLKKRTYVVSGKELLKVLSLMPMGYDVSQRGYLRKYGDSHIKGLKTSIEFLDEKNFISLNKRYKMPVIYRDSYRIFCSIGNLFKVDTSVRNDYLVVLTLKNRGVHE